MILHSSDLSCSSASNRFSKETKHRSLHTLINEFVRMKFAEDMIRIPFKLELSISRGKCARVLIDCLLVYRASCSSAEEREREKEKN